VGRFRTREGGISNTASGVFLVVKKIFDKGVEIGTLDVVENLPPTPLFLLKRGKQLMFPL